MSKTDNNDEKKVKKNGFFRDVLKSIKDFDKYEDFGLEGLGKTSGYLIKLVAIFTLIITSMTVYKFSNTLEKVVKYFDENITELTYEDGKLNVNDNQKLEVESDKYITGTVIIDTSDLSDEQVEDYKNQAKNQSNGIVLLKDKIMLKNEMLSAVSEASYKDLLSKYNINSLDKQQILDYFNNGRMQIYTSAFISLFIYMFFVYFASILVDAIVLGVLAYLVARIMRMKIKFSASFSMGVHALTLPIILNICYVILNGFTGWTTKYFQVMYTAISYIYVVTAILIIRSEYIKKQAEVERIQTEQDRVREELEEKERKEKEQKEKEKEKKEREKQKEKERKQREKEQETPEIGDKPEGSNV